jgi:hypothetical protein
MSLRKASGNVQCKRNIINYESYVALKESNRVGKILYLSNYFLLSWGDNALEELRMPFFFTC